MTKEELTKVREVYAKCGITKYILEFNNNFKIRVGFDISYTYFDDANELIWCWIPKGTTNTTTHTNEPAEVRAYCYSEVQFLHAAGGIKECMAIANEVMGNKLTPEVTKILKELCSPIGIYPVNDYPERAEDGKPLKPGGMPEFHPTMI